MDKTQVLLKVYELVNGDVNYTCQMYALLGALNYRYPNLDAALNDALCYWISEGALVHTGFQRTGKIEIPFGVLFLTPKGVEVVTTLKEIASVAQSDQSGELLPHRSGVQVPPGALKEINNDSLLLE